jgi:hypothetical protein
MHALLVVLALIAAPAAARTFRLPGTLEQLQDLARTDSNEATVHFLLGLALWDALCALQRASPSPAIVVPKRRSVVGSGTGSNVLSEPDAIRGMEGSPKFISRRVSIGSNCDRTSTRDRSTLANGIIALSGPNNEALLATNASAKVGCSTLVKQRVGLGPDLHAKLRMSADSAAWTVRKSLPEGELPAGKLSIKTL